LLKNVDVSIDKITKATVNGVTPYQLTSGIDKSVTIKTNSKGEATFTVTGSNTKATPVVFKDEYVVNKTLGNNTLQPTELRATAETLTFTAIQSTYNIEVTRDGEEEAAIGLDNGRKYNVVVKDKDGKVAAGETVNVAFNETLSKIIGTSSNAYFVKDKAPAGTQITVKLDKDGKGSFVIASSDLTQTDYATPVVWIDINSSFSSTNGKLEEGEPNKVADRTYFVAPKLVGATLKSYLGTTEKDTFTGLETATFKYNAVNQSGKAYNPGNVIIDAEFQVYNSGTEDVRVGSVVISPSRYATIKASGLEPVIQVVSDKNKTTSVVVTAYGIAQDTKANLGHKEAKASFTSTLAIGVIHTGIVNEIDTVDEEITFAGKDAISYADSNYMNVNKVTLNKADFEKLVSDNLNNIRVTVTKDANGKYTFEVVSLNADLTATLAKVNTATDAAAVEAALLGSEFVPAFANLDATQKTAVATSVLGARGNEFTETGLKNAYASAYGTQVTSALAGVASAADATAVAAALAKVPGLDLTAYKALTPANQATVSGGLVADTAFASITALENRITAEIAKIGSAAKLAAVNSAATNAEALVALKELSGVTLTDFNAAPARVKELVLNDVVAATFVDVPAVNALIRTSLVTHEDAASVGITSITADLVTSPNTLTFVFDDTVVLPATIATADLGTLGLTFVDGNTLGAGASATFAANTLVVTLGTGHNVTLSSKLAGITVKDEFGLALDLTAEKADGTLITPAANLEVN